MSEENRNREHLKRVSRSFAFCIEELRKPLRDWVGLAYLLCRLIDTVEDSKWENLDPQLQSFQRIRNFVQSSPETRAVQEWRGSMPKDIPEGERLLLEDAERIFADLHALPPNPKDEIRLAATMMIDGMAHFCEHQRVDGELRLQTEEDLNQYCFFVAGLLGEMLTSLVQLAYRGKSVPPRQWIDSVHFGLYLQKINIFKDQLVDEKEGRHFLPERDRARAGLALNADRAFAYFENIPLEYRDYRIFCGWCFYLGLLSIPKIDRSWEEKKVHKVSRLETFTYLAKVKLMIDNPGALRKMYEQIRPEGDAKATSPRSPKDAGKTDHQWYRLIYQGHLKDGDFLELGLAVG